MSLTHFFDFIKFNPENEKQRIVDFIHSETERQGYTGGVIGLSGGIDSALCAYLMAEALGPENVLGISLCETHSWDKDFEHAKLVADQLGIRFINYPITPILDSLGFYEHIKNIDFVGLRKQVLDSPGTYVEPPLLEYNTRVKLRARGFILSHFAKLNHYFQCQTLHQSEVLLGYLDPFGDAVGDIAPIYHLYKTEIFELAKHMGIPHVINERPPMSGNMNKDGLWTDEDDMGMPFSEGDLILYLLENHWTEKEVREMVNLPGWKIGKINDIYTFAKIYNAIPVKLTRKKCKTGDVSGER